MRTFTEDIAAWRKGSRAPIIDCDIHAQVPSIETLFPYLEPGQRDWILERGYPGPPGVATVYPPSAPSSARTEWRRDDGSLAASSLELVRKEALDPLGLDHAILNCYYALDSCRHPDLARWLASAVNDWLIAEWLEKDERLRASMVVSPHVHADIVSEIERVGNHPGFVQVLMPVRNSQGYGRRNWWPVYEAITKHDLVFGLHWGGTTETAPTASGWPSWYIEEYAGEAQVFMSQLLSMLAEGVFQQFATLRVAVLEIGFAWVPAMLWRCDMEWKGLRRIVPWLNRAPSAIVRDHVRFSTAPLDAGPPQELANIVEWLGEDLLMFATDYPHAHDDDVPAFLEALSIPGRTKVLSENARAFYRL